MRRSPAGSWIGQGEAMGESHQAQSVLGFVLVLPFFVCLFLLLPLNCHRYQAGFLIRSSELLILGREVGEGGGFAGRTGPACACEQGTENVIVTVTLMATFI